MLKNESENWENISIFDLVASIKREQESRSQLEDILLIVI